MKVLIDKTTAAKTLVVDAYKESNRPEFPMTLGVIGTLTTEEITLEYHNGDAWVGMKIEGEDVTLTADTNILTVYGPMTFRVNKPVTANAVGVARS